MNQESFSNERPRHERSDISGRAILLGACGIVVMLLLAALIAAYLTRVGGPARSGPTDTKMGPATLLSSDPGEQVAAYRREKQAELQSYGWIDRDHTVAHIPIERAMQMLAASTASAHSDPQQATP